MFGTLKGLFGRNGQPSQTDVAVALQAHAQDMYDAIEQTFIDSGEPGKATTIRMAFKNGKLLKGIHRYPLYLTMLAITTAVRCGIEDRKQGPIAWFAQKDFTGMSDDQLVSVVGQHMNELHGIMARLREQSEASPAILDSETVLLYAADRGGEELASLLRENRNARLPIDRRSVASVILGLSHKEVTSTPLPETDELIR